MTATYDANGNLTLGSFTLPPGTYKVIVYPAGQGPWSPLASEPVTLHVRRTLFIHSGIHGPTMATDLAGDVQWKKSYLPFGGVLLEGNTDFNSGGDAVNLGFVGRQYDDEVGLYQLGARWYDPDLGRFVTVDPINSSLNQYAYAYNNPFRYHDASGKIGFLISYIVNEEAVKPGKELAKDIGDYYSADLFFQNERAFIRGMGEEQFEMYEMYRDMEADSLWEQIIYQQNACAAVQSVGSMALAEQTLPATPGDVLWMTVGGVGTGIGYASDAKRIFKTADAFDEVEDVARYARYADGTPRGVGWKVGDPITNLTRAGNEPGWNTVKQRLWKSEAEFNPDKYVGNVERMKKGLAPARVNPETGQLEFMELHHTPTPQSEGGLFEFVPVWPSEHRIFHSGG